MENDMTNSQREATDSMIYRIAQAKKQYGSKNADSYEKASKIIKKERV